MHHRATRTERAFRSAQCALRGAKYSYLGLTFGADLRGSFQCVRLCIDS